MTELSRIGVALSTDLVERFDHPTKKRGFTTVPKPGAQLMKSHKSDCLLERDL
jgi:hypothetical protein